MKRRKFFNRVSASIAGLSIAGACTNSQDQHRAENAAADQPKSGAVKPTYRSKIKSTFSTENSKNVGDRVILALIGAGNWGTNLILNAAELNANMRVKYVCDVDDTRGGRAISEMEKMQGSRPIRVRDMRKVFDDAEVDGVIIATPQHWHALATIWACQAGKDVYVEKCISFNIREGQKMIEAAMKYERIIQCGTQNRSAEYVKSAREYIESGELGRVTAVNVMELLNGPIPFNEKEDSKAPDTIDWDMWLGPARKVPFNISRNKSNQFYWDYSGGMAMANGSIHQMDLARIILGDPIFPQSVYCAGGRYQYDDTRETPDYQMVTYDYGDFVLTLQSGEFTPYMAKSSLDIRHGDDFPEWKQNSTKIVVYGSKRVMYMGRMGGGWQVFDNDGKIVAQKSGRFPLKAHLGNYIDCIRSRKQPNGNIVQGHKSAVLMHLANYSYRAGKKQINFSNEFETIANDESMQEMAFGHYRKGFELPENV